MENWRTGNGTATSTGDMEFPSGECEFSYGSKGPRFTHRRRNLRPPPATWPRIRTHGQYKQSASNTENTYAYRPTNCSAS